MIGIYKAGSTELSLYATGNELRALQKKATITTMIIHDTFGRLNGVPFDITPINEDGHFFVRKGHARHTPTYFEAEISKSFLEQASKGVERFQVAGNIVSAVKVTRVHVEMNLAKIIETGIHELAP